MALMFGVRVKTYLKLICEYELHRLPLVVHRISTKTVKVKPPLVCHLLHNHLSKFCLMQNNSLLPKKTFQTSFFKFPRKLTACLKFDNIKYELISSQSIALENVTDIIKKAKFH